MGVDPDLSDVMIYIMPKKGICYLLILVIVGILVSVAYYAVSKSKLNNKNQPTAELYITKSISFGMGASAPKNLAGRELAEDAFTAEIVSYDSTTKKAVLSYIAPSTFAYVDTQKEIQLNCNILHSYLVKENTTLNGAFSIEDYLVNGKKISAYCKTGACTETTEICRFYE